MRKKQYDLKDGMTLQAECYGRTYKLRVVRDGDVFRFRVDDQLFSSLTAAARHVVRDETRQISGPHFWNAPLVKK